MLNAPRLALPIGVRAYETITARDMGSPLELGCRHVGLSDQILTVDTFSDWFIGTNERMAAMNVSGALPAPFGPKFSLGTLGVSTVYILGGQSRQRQELVGNVRVYLPLHFLTVPDTLSRI
jgi:hypothetical protein